jgi:hypothetical protein
MVAGDRMNVLALNPGSSTLKFDVYWTGSDGGAGLAHRAGGLVDRLGTPAAELILSAGDRAATREAVPGAAPAAAARAVLVRARALLADASGEAIDAIGCRVVHGGDRFTAAARASPEVVAAVRELGALAPLHNPLDADVLAACLEHRPAVPVGPCSTLPSTARCRRWPACTPCRGISPSGMGSGVTAFTESPTARSRPGSWPRSGTAARSPAS